MNLNQEIVKQYLKIKSGNQVAKNLNIHPNKVYKILKEEGIKTNLYDKRRGYFLNESFFDRIDAEDKAYFLGWLASDGSVNKITNSILLCIQQLDKAILEEFIKSLNSNLKIKIRKRQYEHYQDQSYIEFASLYMRKSLAKLNIIPNKSLTLIPPPKQLIPENLKFHFMRGFFDGDGGMCIGKERLQNRLKCSAYITSTKEMCEYFQSIIHRYGIISHIEKSNKRHERNTYNLKIYGSYNIIKFCKLIYNESNPNLRLKRKYNLYLIMLNESIKYKKDKYLIFRYYQKKTNQNIFCYKMDINSKKFYKGGFLDRNKCAQECFEILKREKAKSFIIDKFLEINDWFYPSIIA